MEKNFYQFINGNSIQHLKFDNNDEDNDDNDDMDDDDNNDEKTSSIYYPFIKMNNNRRNNFKDNDDDDDVELLFDDDNNGNETKTTSLIKRKEENVNNENNNGNDDINMSLEQIICDDLHAFENRLIEILDNYHRKTKYCRIILIIIITMTIITSIKWLLDQETMELTLLESLMKHKFFTINCLLLLILFLYFGIQKLCIQKQIILQRIRSIIEQFNMDCTEQGRLILMPKSSSLIKFSSSSSSTNNFNDNNNNEQKQYFNFYNHNYSPTSSSSSSSTIQQYPNGF